MFMKRNCFTKARSVSMRAQTCSVTSSRYPVDEANTLFADSYVLLGFRAGFRLDQRILGLYRLQEPDRPALCVLD
jgi:hypothetical protein